MTTLPVRQGLAKFSQHERSIKREAHRFVSTAGGGGLLKQAGGGKIRTYSSLLVSHSWWFIWELTQPRSRGFFIILNLMIFGDVLERFMWFKCISPLSNMPAIEKMASPKGFEPLSST